MTERSIPIYYQTNVWMHQTSSVQSKMARQSLKKMARQRTHEAVATEPILKRKGGEDHVKQLLKPLSALK